MKIPGGANVVTFVHSLIGISLSMVVIYFTLNFLRTRGPSFLQGPAGSVGDAVSGQKWNF